MRQKCAGCNKMTSWEACHQVSKDPKKLEYHHHTCGRDIDTGRKQREYGLETICCKKCKALERQAFMDVLGILKGEAP